MSNIKLGQKVRAPIYGVEGIVTTIAVQLNGNKRACIQAPVQDGKVPETFWLDDIGLDVIDPVAMIDRVQPSASVGTDRLGEHVVDRLSGFVGVIIDACFSMNGCVQHGVQGSYDKPGTEPLVCYFDSGRLMKVADAELTEVVQTRSGGPMTRGRP